MPVASTMIELSDATVVTPYGAVSSLTARIMSGGRWPPHPRPPVDPRPAGSPPAALPAGGTVTKPSRPNEPSLLV
ncbi:MAG: hypothetical protein R2734_07705 [Nocardioides sp.]